MKHVILLMCVTSALADNLLLDNFNGAGNPTPTDINYNLAARQTGSSLGTVTWTSAGNPTQLGHADMPNGLRVAGGGGLGGWASPDHAFSGAECAGGLAIDFDVDPQHGAGGAAWLAINLGMTPATRWITVNDPASHLSLLFHNVASLGVFDGAAYAGGVVANGVPAGTMTHVRLELTDSTDGNPLNGVGQTTVAGLVLAM